MKIAFGIYIFFFLYACSNNVDDIEKLKLKSEANVESAKDVDILYSDSLKFLV
jgi:hypothetical protein